MKGNALVAYDLPAGLQPHIIFVGIDIRTTREDERQDLELSTLRNLGIGVRSPTMFHYVMDDEDMMDVMVNYLRGGEGSAEELVQQTLVYDVSRPYSPSYQSREKVSWYDRASVAAVVFAEDHASKDDWQYLNTIRACQRWLDWPEAKLLLLREENGRWYIYSVE